MRTQHNLLLPIASQSSKIRDARYDDVKDAACDGFASSCECVMCACFVRMDETCSVFPHRGDVLVAY